MVAERQKILIFGATGKLGSALLSIFRLNGHEVVGLGSAQFDINHYQNIGSVLKQYTPDIVINCAALLGIDACEQSPTKANIMNALFPRELSLQATVFGFQLVHFSTDAVFSGREQGEYAEFDLPNPVNHYGFTKYASELILSSHQQDHYIFRIPMLFGPGGNGGQFVEKMLMLARTADELKIAEDIVTSPSYSLDIAKHVYSIVIEAGQPGLFHLSNAGKASLFDLISYAKQKLNFKADITPASYKDFSFIGQKNTVTPLVSNKVPSLRHWQAAFDDYLLTVE